MLTESTGQEQETAADIRWKKAKNYIATYIKGYEDNKDLNVIGEANLDLLRKIQDYFNFLD